MKKIELNIEDEKIWIFVENEILKNITNFVGEKEKIGYLFVDKIKGTNEFRCKYFTPPHKKDISTNSFSEISKKHKKIAKKMRKKNKFLYEIGFYHTHPENYGHRPSSYDLSKFYEKSTPYKVSLFLIVIKKWVRCFVYSYGEKIKEDSWEVE